MVFHALRDVFVYGVADLAADMPRAAAGFGVFVGGLAATYLVYTICAFLCMGRRWNAEWVLLQGENKQRLYPSPFRGARYLFVFFLVGLMICTSIWFGSAMVGFNPWQTAAATIGISVIATYGFASTLGMVSAAIAVHAENSIQVGEYWEFEDGPTWGGIISSINLLSVEMMRYDAETKSTIVIVRPIDHFFNRPRKHIPYNEITMPPIWLEHAELRALMNKRLKEHVL